MDKLKKASFALLAAAVWAVTVIYILLLGVIPDSFTSDYIGSAIFGFILRTAVQLLIICLPTVIAVKKFDFTVKLLPFSLIVMYVLFALYEPPELYLFVYTGEWSAFFNHRPAMPSFQASLYITLQFGIVMLIAAAFAQLDKYVKS